MSLRIKSSKRQNFYKYASDEDISCYTSKESWTPNGGQSQYNLNNSYICIQKIPINLITVMRTSSKKSCSLPDRRTNLMLVFKFWTKVWLKSNFSWKAEKKKNPPKSNEVTLVQSWTESIVVETAWLHIRIISLSL